MSHTQSLSCPHSMYSFTREVFGIALALILISPVAGSSLLLSKRSGLKDLLGGILGGVWSTVSQITSQEQTGGSTWGTSQQDLFPFFLGGDGAANSSGSTQSGTAVPWGTITTYNANPYHSSPDTGVVRYVFRAEKPPEEPLFSHFSDPTTSH